MHRRRRRRRAASGSAATTCLWASARRSSSQSPACVSNREAFLDLPPHQKRSCSQLPHQIAPPFVHTPVIACRIGWCVHRMAPSHVIIHQVPKGMNAASSVHSTFVPQSLLMSGWSFGRWRRLSASSARSRTGSPCRTKRRRASMTARRPRRHRSERHRCRCHRHGHAVARMTAERWMQHHDSVLRVQNASQPGCGYLSPECVACPEGYAEFIGTRASQPPAIVCSNHRFSLHSSRADRLSSTWDRVKMLHIGLWHRPA